MSAEPTALETGFDLNSTETMVRDTARAVFASFGDNAALVALEESDTGYDAGAWAKMSELGWPGFAVDGGSIVEIGLLMEEVGYAAYPSPLLQTTSAALVLGALAPGADLLGRIAGGSIAVLVAPLGGERMSVDGDQLRGGQAIVEWAHAADTLVVLAPDGPSFALAVVEGAEGVRMARSIDNERVGVVALDGARVQRLAAVPAADAAEALARVRLLRAAEMTGGAARVLELTRDYMLERKQFGVALGTFQAVQHHLANMLTDVDAARLAVREGLSLARLGRPAEAAAAIAGYVAGRTYTRTTITAAQLFGGIGAAKEHPPHHYFRRAKGMQMRLGPVPAQLERITDTTVLGESPGPW